MVFEKGHVSWLKGKKGYTNSGSFKRGSSGFNRKHSEESKKKMSKARKGKHYPKLSESKKGSIPWNKGLTAETDSRIMASEKHHRWKGGLVNLEKHRLWNKKYREKNRNKIRARQREFYKKNSEEILQRFKIYYSNLENRKKHNDSTKRWSEKYPEKKNAGRMRYIAIKKQAVPLTVNLKKIEDFYKKARQLTEKTGISYHVDHVIPLSKGGLHHEDNLQVLTKVENCRKGNSLDTNNERTVKLGT